MPQEIKTTFTQGRVYAWVKRQAVAHGEDVSVARRDVLKALRNGRRRDSLTEISITHALTRLTDTGFLIRTGKGRSSRYTLARVIVGGVNVSPLDTRGANPASHEHLMRNFFHNGGWYEPLCKAAAARGRAPPRRAPTPVPGTALEELWGWIPRKDGNEQAHA